MSTKMPVNEMKSNLWPFPLKSALYTWQLHGLYQQELIWVKLKRKGMLMNEQRMTLQQRQKEVGDKWVVCQGLRNSDSASGFFY